MERIAYPGSFRPFHCDHLSIAKSIVENFPECELVIGVARVCKRGDGLISAELALNIVNSSLVNSNIKNVHGQIVDVPKNATLEWAASLLSKNNIVRVFTGSPKTIGILESLQTAGLWNGQIHKLDNGGVHASQIRQWMGDGNNAWKEYVSPEGIQIICNQVI